MAKRRKPLSPDEPLYHANHKRPVTRRDFLAQGLVSGLGMVMGPTIFGLFANPRQAHAILSPDLETLKAACGIATQGAGKIPFICFDLAGGANISGSNVLVGKQGDTTRHNVRADSERTLPTYRVSQIAALFWRYEVGAGVFF